jgi:hypothetical protein
MNVTSAPLDPSDGLPELTEAQKEIIRNNWDKMDLLALTRVVFGMPGVDGRSKFGKAVKKFMSENNLKVRTTEFIKGAEFILTEDQKEYIRNSQGMRAMEISKIIFQRADVKPLSKEFKAVYAYMKECDMVTPAEDEPPQEEIYRAPKKLEQVIGKVNRFCNEDLEEAKLKPDVRRNFLALLKYMSVYRFGYQINTYLTQVDRELFESSFVRYTYDKHDLLEEDVDQYIDLCGQIVSNAQQERYIQLLEHDYREALADDTKRQNSKAFVDMINGSKDKLNQGKARQEKLYGGLVKTRGDRKNKQVEETASILKLVEAWRMKETRDEMIAVSQAQKMIEAKEIDRISSIDDIVALMAGITKEELLYGK